MVGGKGLPVRSTTDLKLLLRAKNSLRFQFLPPADAKFSAESMQSNDLSLVKDRKKKPCS